MIYPQRKPEKAPRKPRGRIRRTSRPRRSARPRIASLSPRAALRRRRDREWADVVKSRAEGRCECPCRQPGTLDAHHVFGKKAHPKLRHELDNGIALLRPCHRWAHRQRDLFRQWFRERRPAAYAHLVALVART